MAELPPITASWRDDAAELLAGLDPRSLVIATERVFRCGPVRPTLQTVGDRLGLTRERVRQLALKIEDGIARHAARLPDLAEAVRVVRDELGLVATQDEVLDALQVAEDDAGAPDVQLVLYLAGPYRRVGGLLLREDYTPAVASALENTGGHGRARLGDVRASLGAAGIRDAHHAAVLAEQPGIQVLDDQVVAWTGTLGDKAATVLGVAQRLMSAEEIHARIGEGGLNTLKNYLGSQDRFIRRGARTWGLSEWGGERYNGVAEEMARVLDGRRDGMPVDRVCRDLGRRFGVPATSVQLMSQTHWRFMREGAWVRLRRSDEPYVPNTALEEDRDCVVVHDRWVLRLVVGRDMLRGSGLLIPEPFAAHLGLLPLGRLTFASEYGDVPVYWTGPTPGIGSLRRVAEALEGTLGDYLMVVPDGGRLDFRVIRADALQGADPVEEVLLRLGQRAEDGPWSVLCAKALGLGAHAPDGVVEDLLEQRGDRDVLRLFRSARLQDAAS